MLASGAFLTFKTGFFQFTHLGESLKTVLGLRRVRSGSTKKNAGEISAFQALATALGGSIGTANIAGVASAIALGGPGAIFWMWMAALAGMATKFSEVVLAIRYRERDGTGSFRGGPMLYIKKGLGGRSGFVSAAATPLAGAFAVFGLLSSLFGTSMVQSNTIAMSAADSAAALGFTGNIGLIRLISGAATALLVGIVIIGGVSRIGRFSEIVVTLMALAYTICCIYVLTMRSEHIIPAFSSIIKSAFGLRPMAGGAVGYSFSAVFRVGVARGIYSNEAGVGSAPMVHACSSSTDPVRQGMYGIFEVFADTIVMCTLTALVVITSGTTIPYGDSTVSGTTIALHAFSTVLSKDVTSIFLASSLFFFAYTSIVGWSVYGMSCAEHLLGAASRRPFCIIYIVLIIIGAMMKVDFVWAAGETLNYLMAIPNTLALILLSGEIKRQTAEYRRFETKIRCR